MTAFFAAAPRTSLTGLQSTESALPFTHYKAEMRDSLLSLPTHTLAVATKDKLSNETQLS